MPSILQLRGGSEAENDSYVGRPREVTVDTTNKTLRVHNGVTPGGFKLTSASDTANQIAAFRESFTAETDVKLEENKQELLTLLSDLDAIVAENLQTSTEALETESTVLRELIDSTETDLRNLVGQTEANIKTWTSSSINSLRDSLLYNMNSKDATLKAELENQINLMQLDSQVKQTARCFSAMLIAAPNGGYYGSTTDINLPAAQSEPNGIRTYTITIPETAVYKLRQESFQTGSRYSEADYVNSVVQNSAGVNLKSFRVHNGRGLTVVNEFQQGDKMIISIPFYIVTNSSESGDVLLTATFEKIGH